MSGPEFLSIMLYTFAHSRHDSTEVLKHKEI